MTSVVGSQARKQVARLGILVLCGALLGNFLLLAVGCNPTPPPAPTPDDGGEQPGPAAQPSGEQPAGGTAAEKPPGTEPGAQPAGQTLGGEQETSAKGPGKGAEPSKGTGTEPANTGPWGEEQPGEQPAGESTEPTEQPGKQPRGEQPAGEGTEPAEQPGEQPSGQTAQEPPDDSTLADASGTGTPTGEQPGTQEPEQPAGEEIEDMDFVNVPTPEFMPDPVPLPESEAQTEAEMKPYTETIAGTDVKFDMVPIRGGKFLMGSPDSEADRNDDEGPQHEVVVGPFWMGKCEVTWGEYELWSMKLDMERRRALKQEPAPQDKIADAVAMPTPPYSDMTFGMGKDGYPAICMTQFAAKMYCKWLSAKTGRYYRLPTEAEWEYACRAGTTTAYSFGDDPDELDDYGWYFDNSDDKYHRVGQKKPNPWGLYDMHGNVAEWVLDQHVSDFYTQFAGKTAENPLAAATKIYPRVVRGGSWDGDPEQLRSAARMGSVPKWKEQDPQIPQSVWYLTDANFVGFRVVRPLRKPTAEEAKKYEVDEAQLREYREWYEAEIGSF